MLRKVALFALFAFAVPVLAQGQDPAFSRMDVFDLEWVASPQI